MTISFFYVLQIEDYTVQQFLDFGTTLLNHFSLPLSNEYDGKTSITSSILQSKYWHISSIVFNDTYSFFDILARVAVLNPTSLRNCVLVMSFSNNNLNNGL